MRYLRSFGQRLLRRFSRGLVRLYYPGIEITGRENIPSTGPVLFVANHANSLIDPVLIGICAKRRVRFLARAPLFETPVFGWALKAAGMLPAARGADDRRKVRANFAMFDDAVRALAAGDAVGVFPEGESHDSPVIRMIRSGAARIAVHAVRDGVKDLRIVPVGLNYERKEEFLSSVWIDVGAPIDAARVIEEQGGDERKAVRALTGAVENGLRTVVTHIGDPAWAPFLDHLESLLPPPPEARRMRAGVPRWRRRLAEAMNDVLDREPARGASLGESIGRYRQRVATAGLSLESPILHRGGWRLCVRLTLATLSLGCGAVPLLLGTVHHAVPFRLVRALAPLFQQPGRATTSLARIALGVPIYAAWYALVWFAMNAYFVTWVATAWVIAMPIAGVFALKQWRRARMAGALWVHQIRLLPRRSAVEKLRRRREEICRELAGVAEEYRRRAGPDIDETERRVRKPLLARAAAAAAATAVAAGIGCIALIDRGPQPVLAGVNDERTELAGISAEVLRANLDRDQAALVQILAGTRELEERAYQLREDFLEGRRGYFSQADNDAIRQLLLSYLNYRTALLRIIWRYRDHAAVDDEGLRARSFLTGFAAGSALYEMSLKFVVQFGETPEAVRKLNEPEPLWDVPAGVYDAIWARVTDPETVRLYAEATDVYTGLATAFDRYHLRDAEPYPLLHDVIDRAAGTAHSLAPVVALPVPPVLDDLVARTEEAVYRGKSLVALWIGDARIRAPREGAALIQAEALEKFRGMLRPGDILLERRNWYLSNAFLPGFWPHSALYVGTVEDLERMGLADDPRVEERWREFIAGDVHGDAHVIIESMSEGVVFTSLEYSVGGADSAAVLRPNLSEEAIRESIARAFSHVGKPYDFDFDFFSTDKLVCTELVFRAYDGEIDFPLVDILGRKTMPALELVRKYAEEQGLPSAQLDFIAFLDGDESLGRAEFRDAREFLSTLERPALTWLH